MCICEFSCPIESRKGVDTPGNEITGSSKHPDMGVGGQTSVLWRSSTHSQPLSHHSLYCLGYFAIKLGILPLQMDS